MKMNKKGFTLAELLIVIAIIAILIAIAIPVFGAQLENARVSADHANIRSAYGLIQTVKLSGVELTSGGYDVDGDNTADVKLNDYYTSDGNFQTLAVSNAKVIKSSVTKAPNTTVCAKAVGCKGTHKDGMYIKVVGTGLSDIHVEWNDGK